MSVRGVLRSRTFAVLLGVLLVVAVLWVALPALATSYVNRKLSQLEDYTGEVERVSFHLLKGAYRAEELELRSRRAPKEPFLTASAIDLSLDGRALLSGSFVAEIDVHDPVLDYVPRADAKKSEKTWQEALTEVTPFRIDRLTLHDGRISYRKSARSAPLTLTDVDLVARNLTNSADLAENLFTRFEGSAVTLGSGQLSFEGRANPSAKTPTFDLELELEELELKDATALIPSSAGFRPEEGTISLDADLSASRGRARGIGRAHLRGLDATDIGRAEGDLAGKLWERARELAKPHLGEQRMRDVKVRVPIEVTLTDPAGSILAAVAEVTQTALRRAVQQSLRDVLPWPGRPREN